jgi:hypothetical protein
VTNSIAELPFRERPVIELLALDRDEPDPEYAGYGWARVPRVWLDDGRALRPIDDVLVVAIHADDHGDALPDDVELEFDLPDGRTAEVLASDFLERWLPRLPSDVSAIVLAMCNPHRAMLRIPHDATVPVHHALGDVFAWIDPDHGDRIRLAADAWRTLRPVSTALQKTGPTKPFDDDEKKQTLAGLYVLKKMDLKSDEGGMTFPVVLPSELQPLDEVLQQLAVDDYVVINHKKSRWDLTKKGIEYLGRVIDEATDLIDEFDEDELPEVVEELQRRRIDLIRARFIWGWYDGEFDDLVQWQEQRGVKPVERMWAFYLMSDEFWNELAVELEEAAS